MSPAANNRYVMRQLMVIRRTIGMQIARKVFKELSGMLCAFGLGVFVQIIFLSDAPLVLYTHSQDFVVAARPSSRNTWMVVPSEWRTVSCNR